MPRKATQNPSTNRTKDLNRYDRVIEHVFISRFHPGDRSVDFVRKDLEAAAEQLGIEPPSNKGDVLYSYRFRGALPSSITSTAPSGEEWIIRLAGRGRYRFDLVPSA